MVVKAVRGRRRYIVFTVPAETGRTEVLNGLSGLTASMPDIRVITSFGGKAIVRCSPPETDAVKSAMSEAFPGSESLITSGTLRKVREVYPELKVKQKKKC
jgi:RNase P/RNase MRP subunit POP5